MTFQTENWVIGNGWSALATVAILAKRGEKVLWHRHETARFWPALSTIENGPGVEVWEKLFEEFEISAGELQTGSFLREFKNKSFRMPPWIQSATAEQRQEVRDEMLWTYEHRAAPVSEAKWSRPIVELEDELREKISAMENVTIYEGILPYSIEESDSGIHGRLSNEEIVTANRVFFAGMIEDLRKIEGVQKSVKIQNERYKWIDFTRKWKPGSALQVEFRHSPILVQSIQSGVMSLIPKGPGEETIRHLWGYFLDQGKRSRWTIFLSSDEQEDNNEITKKLRRLKQTLNKIFHGSEWLPEGVNEFTQSIQNETVRLEIDCFYSEGKPLEKPIQLSNRFTVLTDGFGPMHALKEVGDAFGLLSAPAQVSDPQNTNTDSQPSAPAGI